MDFTMLHDNLHTRERLCFMLHWVDCAILMHLRYESIIAMLAPDVSTSDEDIIWWALPDQKGSQKQT